MVEVINAESPLVGVEDEPTALITEIPMRGFINLRGNAGQGRTKYCTQIKKVLGVSPPVKHNTINQNDQYQIYWLGPDESLLITPPNQQLEVVVRLEAALRPTFFSVSDVSSGYTMIEISGRYAETLLRKGCPLDLHTSVFLVGHCAQTVIAQAGALIFRNTDADGFVVCVRRSYADYLLRWLNNANTGF